MTERITYEKAKEMMKKEKSLFFSIHRQEHLAMHPKYTGDLKKGVTSTLDSLMSLYQERFDGVPLAYNKVQLLQNQANFISYQPYLHFDVTAEFIVFKPKVGCCLKGVIQKVESNHVSCLVHGVFNAWCPKKPLLDAMNESDPTALIDCKIELTITKLSSNGGVLSMKGTFNKLISKRPITSDMVIIGTPNNQKKAFDDCESDEGKPVSPNTPSLNHSFCPELCSTQLPTPFIAPERQRKRKLSIHFESDNSLDTSDRQQGTSDGIDSTSYTKVKKKKKSKHEVEEVDGIETSSSMDNVVTEGSTKKRKKEKHENVEELNRDEMSSSKYNVVTEGSAKKRKKEKHEKVEEVNGDEMNSSVDISVTKGSAKKKKKNEKHEKVEQVNGDEMNSSVDIIVTEGSAKKKKKKEKREKVKEVNGTNLSSSIDNIVKEASAKKKKKEKHREVNEAEIDSSMDNIVNEASFKKKKKKKEKHEKLD